MMETTLTKMQCPRAIARVSRSAVIVSSSPSALAPRLVHNALNRTWNRNTRDNAIVSASASTESWPSTMEDDDMSIEDLKAVLQDTLWGTERGLSADSDTRAEILELISQLEGRNPTPEPNEAGGLDKLTGTWKLVYTSNSELLPLLLLSRLPLVEVGDVTQTIDPMSLSVENRVQLSVPFSRTSLGATAAFEVRSPKLLQVQFNEGRVATPELLADFELPASVDVLGQTIDLTPLQAALSPLDGPVRAAVAQLGSLLSGAPDLRLPINGGDKSTTWLLNTYLDDDLRISRGDGGSVFVMVKDPLVFTPGLVAAASEGEKFDNDNDDEPYNNSELLDGKVTAAEVVAAVQAIEADAVLDPDVSGSIDPSPEY